ncbi:major facilitator superfamily MFS_1 [Emticicia oligotrophica DSM 17448]|uniref:Major facilitator superfamily MFS_1 n=1 Tax=Emticicia oligotrophica (strain DSM 17448 / CIP 109782 / MTCC 6937 / GPTSA100-15) TaxID=929562 RepID=A0ABN4AI86_EMTOG|nr:MFS transporter [Emticicia oligotrophica]AFK01577.1 major facilitator superfamily MFS_1 [Emticicia oligotrophica DSM 17448]
MFIKNQKKVLNAWTMYDWANSVHNLVITTVVFPMYFLSTTSVKDANGNVINDVVNFFGFEIQNSILYSYTISAATLFLAILNPILTPLADSSGRRKFFMKLFCYLGAASCAYFYFFTKDTVNSAVVAFGLSIIGWGGSIVFYNSFLPVIATEDQFDSLSAKGFTMGYIGSVILLIVNLLMIMQPTLFGLTQADSDSGFTARISFLTVGVWWALFAQIPFYFLPKDEPKSFKTGRITTGVQELMIVLKEIRSRKLITKFLTAFLFYDMGVMTVIYVATIFADKELHIEKQGLIITLLLIQLIAIPGSYLASWLSSKFGNTKGLLVFIFIWGLMPLAAYFTTTQNEFYVIAAVVGLVMGGIQSLSRSTFAKLLPDDTKDTASYFGFYDIVEKLATTLGTLIFGAIGQITGDMRNSVLSILVFFIVGFVLLMRVPSKKVYH